MDAKPVLRMLKAVSFVKNLFMSNSLSVEWYRIKRNCARESTPRRLLAALQAGLARLLAVPASLLQSLEPSR